MYIVIQNGLQYNTHDSGYSNKHTTDKGKKGRGRKKEETQWMETGQNHHFLD